MHHIRRAGSLMSPSLGTKRLDLYCFPFFSPLSCFSGIAGPEEAKNLAGKVLRLIQIRLRVLSFKKSRESVKPSFVTNE